MLAIDRWCMRGFSTSRAFSRMHFKISESIKAGFGCLDMWHAVIEDRIFKP